MEKNKLMQDIVMNDSTFKILPVPVGWSEAVIYSGSYMYVGLALQAWFSIRRIGVFSIYCPSTLTFLLHSPS